MTKEELLNKIDTWGVDHIAITGIKDCIEQFIESNVCIPKGENCHPYHMELHQWAENPLCDLQVFNDSKGYFTLSLLDEYRIKPSEPIYEWQYLLLGNGKNSLSEKFYTDDEFNDSLFLQKYIKLEETKRERT